MYSTIWTPSIECKLELIPACMGLTGRETSLISISLEPQQADMSNRDRNNGTFND